MKKLIDDNKDIDIGIIGGGPGGYAAAVRAAQKGCSVVLFEKDCVGGVCLNRGCIPTKVIMHCCDFYKNLKKADKFGICVENASIDYAKIFERKNNISLKIQGNLRKLILSHGVKIVDAEAEIAGEKLIRAQGMEFHCENIIISTGAKPGSLTGLACDGEFVFNSDQLLNLSELPDEILIVGSGAIGVEWARVFSALNKSVTVVEIAENLLPAADKDIGARLERLFKKEKIKFFKNTYVEKIEYNEKRSVVLSNGSVIHPDMILVAAGREPVLPEFCGLEIALNKKFVDVNENFQTNFENIFAIGDVNGKIQLAHAATHQAICVVDFIFDKKPSHFDVSKIPSVIYGSPEIAWVGKTESDLAQSLADGEYKVSCFPIAALGKAQADDEIDGMIKVLGVEGKIVGAHVIAPEASALIQQFTLMIDNGIDVADVLKTTFSHPTYSEGVFESLLGLDNMSLSLMRT